MDTSAKNDITSFGFVGPSEPSGSVGVVIFNIKRWDLYTRQSRSERESAESTGPVHSYDNMERLSKGEIRLGDYNAPWGTYCSKACKRWMQESGALEVAPDKPSHEQGKKLDQIITKDCPD